MGRMSPGAVLIAIGIVLVLAGVLWQVGFFKYVPLGRLPGDIHIKGKSSSFYFPITTCILLSLIFSGLLKLFNKFFS
jgi:hypothetical protein